jgi:hypothetical protein
MASIPTDLIQNVPEDKYFLLNRLCEIIDKNYDNQDFEFLRVFNDIAPLFKYNYRTSIRFNKYARLMKNFETFLKFVIYESDFDYSCLSIPDVELCSCDSSNDRCYYEQQNKKKQLFEYLSNDQPISHKEISRFLVTIISKIIVKITIKFSMYS